MSRARAATDHGLASVATRVALLLRATMCGARNGGRCTRDEALIRAISFARERTRGADVLPLPRLARPRARPAHRAARARLPVPTGAARAAPRVSREPDAGARVPGPDGRGLSPQRADGLPAHMPGLPRVRADPRGGRAVRAGQVAAAVRAAQRRPARHRRAAG